MLMFSTAGAALISDLLLSVGIGAGAIYIAVVLMAGLTDRRDLAIGAAVFCSLLMLGGLGLSPPGADFAIAVLDRVVALLAIWLAALFVLARRSAAERELLRLETDEQCRRVIDSTPDAVALLDLSGKVVSWSMQGLRMFGWSEDESKGRALSEVILPERERGEFDGRLTEFRRTGDAATFAEALELDAKRSDGPEFPVSIALFPTTQRGEVLLLAVMRDLARDAESQQELQRVAHELETRNEEMEEIVSIIAHDLKRPIVSISGLLNMIREDAGESLDAESIENLDLSINECRRMQSMVTELSALARAERAEWSFGEENLRDLIEACVSNAQPLAESKGARLVFDCDDADLLVSGRHVRECLTNLIENALHYGCPQPGMTVEIAGRVKEAERLARISVTDRGPGIPPVQQSRMFELFRRGDPAGPVKGSGIGLFAVKRLIQQIGGTIAVESPAPRDANQTGRGCDWEGSGARFTLSFPIRVSSRTATRPAPEGDRSLHRIR